MNKDEFNQYMDYLRKISEKYPASGDSAIAVFKQMLHSDSTQNQGEKKAWIFLQIGEEYLYKIKDTGLAMGFFHKAAIEAEKSSDCTLKIWALIDLNQGYFDLGDMNNFYKNYEQAANIYENCPSSNMGLHIHTELGSNYMEEKYWDLAEKNLLKADSILNNNPIEDFVDSEVIFIRHRLCKFYTLKKDKRKTIYYAKKATTFFAKNITKPRTGIRIYKYISDIFRNINQLDSAIYYAKYLSELPPQKYTADQSYISDAFNLLADLHAMKGDFKQAFYYKNKYIQYLDSLKTAQIHNISDKAIQSAQRQVEIERKQSEIEQDNMLLYAISSIVLLTLVVIYVLYQNAKKLRQLNELLENQRAELAALNDIRAKMFSVLAHDLRSPIGALKNMLEMYNKGFFSQEDFHSFTIDLKYNLDGIFRTLNNILNWSFTQLNGKKPFIEPLNAYQLVAEQFDLQLATARNKQILLINNVPTNFMVNADINHLSLIVRNLLDNALKYTPEGGTVEIRGLNVAKGKILEFQDSGKGMSMEKMKNLFNFNDTHTKINTFNTKGIGLGLQMVGDLIKVNHSTISVSSKENEGSIFALLFKE